MLFELEPDNRNVPDEEVIADLKRLSEQLGDNRLTQRYYRQHGRFSTAMVERRFGSLNQALSAAGLAISKRHGIEDEELFANLESIWRHLGRQPHRSDLDRVTTTVNKSVYEYRFGSWRKALEAFVIWANTEGEMWEVENSAQFTDRTTPRQPNLRLRFRVMNRDRFRCVYCGRSPAMSPGCELHIDHIIAWSSGGETVFENLQTLCSDCNSGKSNCLAISPTEPTATVDPAT